MKSKVLLGALCIFALFFSVAAENALIVGLRVQSRTVELINPPDSAAAVHPFAVTPHLAHDPDYFSLKIVFRPTAETGYPNIFQTASGNSGIRAELHRGILALIYPDPDIPGGTRVLILANNLVPGTVHSLTVTALRGSLLTARVDAGPEQVDSNAPQFSTAAIVVGAGFDPGRAFHGSLSHIEVRLATARSVWAARIALVALRLALAIALGVFILPAPGFAASGRQASSTAAVHAAWQIPALALSMHWTVPRTWPGLMSWLWPTTYAAASAPLHAAAMQYAFAFAIANGIALGLAPRRRPHFPDRSRTLARGLGIIAFELVLAGLSSRIDGPTAYVAWLALAGVLPFSLLLENLPSSGVRLIAASSTALGALALVACMVWLYATNWNPALRFVNDETALHEYTIMRDGKVVDNHAFVRAHAIVGDYPFDPCAPGAPARCLQLARRPLGSAENAFNLFPPSRGIIYDWDRGELEFYHAPSLHEQLLVKSIWGK
ncbi:MAG: hypothetical protein ACYCSN_12605, partial [Acidobacteriaceae bacterium]